MKKSIKTEGIVIKRMDMGEADRLLTIFTRDIGKVRALARGARKPLSRLAGHIEPFSHTQLQLHEGRNFYTVSGADLLGSYDDIRTDLEKTSIGYYLLEMVDALTVDEQAQPDAFHLICEGLTELETNKGDRPNELLPMAFILRLLSEVGYLPELSHCIHCNVVLQPEGNVFSIRLGGLLGPECAGAAPDRVKVSVNAIKVMRLLVSQPISIIQRCTIEAPVVTELNRITENYLRYHVGRELYSHNFLKTAVN